MEYPWPAGQQGGIKSTYIISHITALQDTKIGNTTQFTAASSVITPHFTKFSDKNLNHIHPLGLRVSGYLSDIVFSKKNNLVASVSSTLPWNLVSLLLIYPPQQ